ncbi:hypothetical protein [Halobellus clavatus]|jgi:hypothetical protein|nr:hypothetical protein [Halobellus clavatus]
MAAGTRSHGDPSPESESHRNPEITVCESCPGRSVFLESGNTDGWIASDLTIEVRR